MLSKNILGTIFMLLGLIAYYYETYNILKSILYICLFEFMYTTYVNWKTVFSPQIWLIYYILTHLIDNFPSISNLSSGRLILYSNTSDAIQQLIGKKWGKVKIVHFISPNKTLEGYVGGFVTMLMVSYLAEISINYYIIGILGDLLFSYSKRQLNIKDWSGLLGSHGGFLDRFNSSIGCLFFYLNN